MYTVCTTTAFCVQQKWIKCSTSTNWFGIRFNRTNLLEDHHSQSSNFSGFFFKIKKLIIKKNLDEMRLFYFSQRR